MFVRCSRGPTDRCWPGRAVADAGKEEGDAKNLEDFVLENPLVMVEFYGASRCLPSYPPSHRRGTAQPCCSGSAPVGANRADSVD